MGDAKHRAGGHRAAALEGEGAPPQESAPHGTAMSCPASFSARWFTARPADERSGRKARSKRGAQGAPSGGPGNLRWGLEGDGGHFSVAPKYPVNLSAANAGIRACELLLTTQGRHARQGLSPCPPRSSPKRPFALRLGSNTSTHRARPPRFWRAGAS